MTTDTGTGQLFRQVLGHFCTGVTVITTVDADGPAGFTCQSFAAVSLDPPLVLFCPSRASATWPRIERAGHFCANVLADEQRELARVFAGRGPRSRRRGQVRRRRLVPGAVRGAGARRRARLGHRRGGGVHEAGDHYVVTGRVTGLRACRPGPPLLFYKGRYAVTAPGAGDGPPEVVDSLLAWPRHADWI